jgi:N,N'-diacetyllegionaminate synthase
VGVEIIAELAQGYEGRPDQALLLLKAAACAGADAAKFQLVYADELATSDYKQYPLFRQLEMPDEVWSGLARSAEELGTQLSVDVFGARSLGLAEQIGVKMIKLHGTDISNLGFLEQVARSSIPRILLGAGGAHAAELGRALQILAEKQVVVLLGFQGYPTPNVDNQIDRVRVLASRLDSEWAGVRVGFADHAPPNTPLRYALAAAAVGAGAGVIEKHLTLGAIMKLEDHESALNPDEFAEFCVVVRACADAMGTTEPSDDFGMSESERTYRRMIRRHAVARRDMPAGTRIEPSDVVLKRTSAEFVITELEAVYGRTLVHGLSADSPLEPGAVE